MIDTRVKLRIARHTDRLDEVAAFWRVNAQAYADPDGFLLLLAVSS